MRGDHNYDCAPMAEWYYCSVHRVSHCITRIIRDGRLVVHGCPIAGECAWLYFAPNEVELMPMHDVFEMKVEATDDSNGDGEGDTISPLATLFDALTLADGGSTTTAPTAPPVNRTSSRPRRTRSLPYDFSPNIEAMMFPQDGQDDYVVMEGRNTDTGSDTGSTTDTTSSDQNIIFTPSSSEDECEDAAADETTIHIPIHRPLVDSNNPFEVRAIMRALVPPGADESVLSSIQRAGPVSQRLIRDCDRNFRVEFFTYTDAFGMEAAQPFALDMDGVRRYFRPLGSLEKDIYNTCNKGREISGYAATGRDTVAVDPLLHRLRDWSC